MKSKIDNVPGLLQHHDALQGLLKVARSGFPSHICLREALLILHQKHGILKQSSSSSTDEVPRKVFDEASEAWRNMTKDIFNVKNDGKNIPLQKLIDLIELPKAEDLVSDHCSPKPKSLSDGALEPSASLQLDDVIKAFPC